MIKDFLGNELKIGDVIAYPMRQSSSLWMSYGKIVEFKGRKIRIYGGTHNTYRTLTNTKTVVLVTQVAGVSVTEKL